LQKLTVCKICYSICFFWLFFFILQKLAYVARYVCFILQKLALGKIFYLVCLFVSLFFYFFVFWFVCFLFLYVILTVQQFSRSTSLTSISHFLYGCPLMILKLFISPFKVQGQSSWSFYGQSKVSTKPLVFEYLFKINSKHGVNVGYGLSRTLLLLGPISLDLYVLAAGQKLLTPRSNLEVK
jgi:hypothetical protein